jgi:glyoxylase-like metal-dependent hydrolase (beta-lactamase superfamily II)
LSGLVQEWFRVWEDRTGVWVIEEPLHSEQVKSYLVLGENRAALIDTGMGVGNLRRLVEEITDLPIVVILSHAHNDHIGSAWQFDDVGIHPAEADDLSSGQSAERLANWFSPSEMSGPLPSTFDPIGYSIPGRNPDRYYNDGDVVDLGGRQLEVIFAPGHSRGGLVFLDRADRTLFSTDVVYLRSLYLLNPDSSPTDYATTLVRLAPLTPALDRLYPSHGPTPIDPGVIPPMRDAMREIAAGRKPEKVEYESEIDGGSEESPVPFAIEVHEFGAFRVLVAGR